MLLVLLHPRLRYWIKTISQFISVQLLVQALSFTSGILLIRTLDQTEYAYFTIANTMQSTMNLLADTGIGISISAIGGKVWQDRYRFGQLINTAMQLRHCFAVISMTLVTPILLWMLVQNGAAVLLAILITVSVLFGVNFQITTGVMCVVPQLHSQIRRLQNLDLLVAFSRLALLGLAYLTFLNVLVAVTVSSIIAGLQHFILHRWVSQTIDITAPVSQDDRKFMLTTVKNVVPNAIFFCFQGQLNILLISIFGNTQHIAEVGALGRIGVIFYLINSIMKTIILPSFSRCQNPKTLHRRYFQIFLFFVFTGVFLIVITMLFTDKFLWVLGGHYSNLRRELVLMMVSTVTTSIVEVMSSMNHTKAWVEYAWLEIPMRILLQIFLLISLDISSVKGVILFNLLSNISPFLVNVMLTYRGFATYKSA
jgi:O-antigen/teichoic acid export membrane protein